MYYKVCEATIWLGQNKLQRYNIFVCRRAYSGVFYTYVCFYAQMLHAKDKFFEIICCRFAIWEDFVFLRLKNFRV